MPSPNDTITLTVVGGAGPFAQQVLTMTRAVFTSKANGIGCSTLEQAIEDDTADQLFDQVRDHAFNVSPVKLAKDESARDAFFNLVCDAEDANDPPIQCYTCAAHAEVFNGNGEPAGWVEDGYKTWVCACCAAKHDE